MYMYKYCFSNADAIYAKCLLSTNFEKRAQSQIRICFRNIMSSFIGEMKLIDNIFLQHTFLESYLFKTCTSPGRSMMVLSSQKNIHLF